ncbi:hypothetical protein C5B94_05105 [Clavibacter michiganensis]|uniref:hypothetical protein n=1 Tax=Clavibacter michiganensis TaxID=28447 RepID=UPI000CE762DD|nr:hypothetical protein [Clavibacter michiganensis]PPF55818.1 hypothetical protein C5B94_05105 [Clavibacter michiganensis]
MPSPAVDARGELRRAVVVWSLLAALLVGTFLGTVASLNQSTFSAHGFVRSYLDALARGDSRDALATPGVILPETGSRALLDARALPALDDVELVADEPADGGGRTVTYAYTLPSGPGSTSFRVRELPAALGLFARWEFQTSPVAAIDLELRHASTFTANGLSVEAEAGGESAAGAGSTYLVLAPGALALDHASRYLDAEDVDVAVTEPGSVVPARVDAEPTDELVESVRTEVEAYLTECTTQSVLFPSGCPFGKSIRDRITAPPVWSMTSMPEIALQPASDDPADLDWVVPSTVGTAHIDVPVRSLYDGSVKDLDEDVPFSVSWRVSVDDDAGVRIQGL